MAAQGSGAPPAKATTIEALIEALDPEVRAAIDDADRTLIAIALHQSPCERLTSAARFAPPLARIRDASASQGAGPPGAARAVLRLRPRFIWPCWVPARREH